MSRNAPSPRKNRKLRESRLWYPVAHPVPAGQRPEIRQLRPGSFQDDPAVQDLQTSICVERTIKWHHGAVVHAISAWSQWVPGPPFRKSSQDQGYSKGLFGRSERGFHHGFHGQENSASSRQIMRQPPFLPPEPLCTNIVQKNIVRYSAVFWQSTARPNGRIR